jgi:hypothetical protein
MRFDRQGGGAAPHPWVLRHGAPRSAWARRALWTAGALLATACGHPATTEECQEIFERSAAIELRKQQITEPELVRQRTEEARATTGDDLLKQCLGRRITDRAMQCVRRADTAEELEACLM